MPLAGVVQQIALGARGGGTVGGDALEEDEREKPHREKVPATADKGWGWWIVKVAGGPKMAVSLEWEC